MNKEQIISILIHLLIACVPPIGFAVLCTASGMDCDYGFAGSLLMLFSGILPVIFIFIGEHSTFYAPVIIIVRLAIIIHYPYRTFKKPETRRKMYWQNAVLTLLTAASGHFIMFASRQ